MDIRWLRPERRGIDIRAYRDHEIKWLIAKSVQHRRKEWQLVLRLVEDGPESRVHEWSRVTQRLGPVG